jgi:hypothetical protein
MNEGRGRDALIPLTPNVITHSDAYLPLLQIKNPEDKKTPCMFPLVRHHPFDALHISDFIFDSSNDWT